MKSTVILTVAAALLSGVVLGAPDPQPQNATSTLPSGDDSAGISAIDCRLTLIDTAELASDSNGIIEFIEPEEGDRVERGRIVAGLRADVAKASYEVARITAANDVEVRYAEASKELADAELAKSLQANEEFRNAVPEIEVHRLRLAVKKAMLEIENAQHKFDINLQKEAEAKAQLQGYSVEAPIDGIVTQVNKKRGEAVRQGDVILMVVNTDRLKVEGNIHTKDAYRVQRGMPVAVRLLDPDTGEPLGDDVFRGRVMLVDPEVNAVRTNLVRVVAEVTNRKNAAGNDLLKAGLKVGMTILPD